MNEHLLNPEALEKAIGAVRDRNMFTLDGAIAEGIRTYLASLPPVDAEPVGQVDGNGVIQNWVELPVGTKVYTAPAIPLQVASDLVDRLRERAKFRQAMITLDKVAYYERADLDLDREAAAAIQSLQGEREKALEWAKNGQLRAEAAEAEVARLKAELERLHELDTCMCGSSMDGHNIGSGHSPVSMYDYYRSQDKEEIKRLKAELAEGCDLLDRFDGHLPTVRRYLERARAFRDGQKTGEKG